MWGSKIVGIVFLVGLLLFSLIISIRIFAEETSKPQNITVSNLTDSQATLTWYTQKEVKGVILISENPNFPLKTFLSKNIHSDVRDSGFNWKSYKTHLVTISGLSERKKYYFRIYEGAHNMFQGSFTTGPKLKPTRIVWSAQGKVLEADGKTPASEEIVYYQLVSKKGSSAPMTTLTDKQGFYHFDLQTLRTRDYQSYYNIKNSDEAIYVERDDKNYSQTYKYFLVVKTRYDLVI